MSPSETKQPIEINTRFLQWLYSERQHLTELTKSEGSLSVEAIVIYQSLLDYTPPSSRTLPTHPLPPYSCFKEINDRDSGLILSIYCSFIKHIGLFYNHIHKRPLDFEVWHFLGHIVFLCTILQRLYLDNMIKGIFYLTETVWSSLYIWNNGMHLAVDQYIFACILK